MSCVTTSQKHLLLCALLVCALGLVTAPTGFAQPIDLSVLPASVVNQPDYDLFGLQRPALSITGFDNEAPGYDPAFGLGLKQVLEARFVDNDPLVTPVFDRLIALAQTDQQNPYLVGGDDLVERRAQLNRNTAILQGRAFEALATFVLELNGYDPPALHPAMRSHGVALDAFRDALGYPPGGLIYGDWLDDYVKYGRSVANVARAIDLYLGLENAYLQVLGGALPPFPGLRPDLLLTEAERVAVMTEFATALIIQETVLTTRAVDLYAADLIDLFPPEVVEDLLEQLSHLPAGERTVEEVEAGNWAMKQRAAAGYGALAMQIDPGDPYAPTLRGLREKAFESLTVTHRGDKSRKHHWNWMTYSGERFWPESTYYLDFALEEVLAFWHAARANGLLGNGEDPFFSSWFTNALHWHADLVTPDGRVTAMDDGNKVPVRYGGLMRWNGSYGDAELGRKYAWIEETLNGPARRDEALLLELAIPRTRATQPPANLVGNAKGPLHVNRSEQQLIVRSKAAPNDTHFLFLNGEHGVAVDRGEGHEQADQLNLLYYVGNASYLADSGYDRGYTVENSFWNHYYDHNVMTVGGAEGGLDPPMLNILDVRKQSEPEDMGQVSALYYQNHGMVTSFHGEQTLEVESDPRDRADYVRDVLFIDGENPYIIDLNSIRRSSQRGGRNDHNDSRELDRKSDDGRDRGYESNGNEIKRGVALGKVENQNDTRNRGRRDSGSRGRPGTCEGNVFNMLYHVNSGDATVPPGYKPRVNGFLRWNYVDGQSDRALDLFPMSVEHALDPGAVELVPDQILESENNTDGKVLVDIKKLVLSNEDRCERYWTVAALLHPTSPGASAGAPALLQTSGREATRRGWVWRRNNETYDVFVARSVSDPRTKVTFSLSDADERYPDLDMTLPAGLSHGFARVTEGDEGWSIDPRYNVGLVDGEYRRRRWAGKTDASDLDQTQIPYGLSDVYPNPANPIAAFTLRVRADEDATVAVYDVTGRRIAILFDGVLAADTPYQFRVDGSLWASGAYFVRLQGSSITETRTFLLTR